MSARNYHRVGRYYGQRPGARWMALKYAGRCSVCGEDIAVGVVAFYSPADKSVTCSATPCAKARGLTKEEWHGAPTSGRYVDVLDANGHFFRPEHGRAHGPARREPNPLRDPGEDMADRWNEGNA